MQPNLRVRLGLPAAIAVITIVAMLAALEALDWELPAALGVALLVILVSALVTSLAAICYELAGLAMDWRQARKSSPAWVSREEPGLLDYEADGMRAIGRLETELRRLAKDARRIDETIAYHERRLSKVDRRQGNVLQQVRTNDAGRSFDTIAVAFTKKTRLLHDLGGEISRNFGAFAALSEAATEEHRAAAGLVLDALERSHTAINAALLQTGACRQNAARLHDSSQARAVRVTAGRLATCLEDLENVLRTFQDETMALRESLAGRLSTSEAVLPETR